MNIEKNNNVKMLTIKEAAEVIYGISEHRIRQLCKSGELSHFKAGKKYLINENSLIEKFTQI